MTDTVSLAQEYRDEMRRLSRLLDGGIKALRDAAVDYATAERDYRLAVALAWVHAPYGTVPERKAWVDGECAGARYSRDLAQATRYAAWAAVESRRAQLSALQTAMKADTTEMTFAQYGPE